MANVLAFQTINTRTPLAALAERSQVTETPKRGVDVAGSLRFPSTASGHRHILEFAACQTDIYSGLVYRENKKGENMQRAS